LLRFGIALKSKKSIIFELFSHSLRRTLVTESDILLMDKPFSALDPLIRTQLQDELIQLQEKLNKTIIYVSHDLDEALKLGTNNSSGDSTGFHKLWVGYNFSEVRKILIGKSEVPFGWKTSIGFSLQMGELQDLSSTLADDKSTFGNHNAWNLWYKGNFGPGWIYAEYLTQYNYIDANGDVADSGNAKNDHYFAHKSDKK
jgi:hypothetical protein